jgi:hypothetical protein
LSQLRRVPGYPILFSSATGGLKADASLVNGHERRPGDRFCHLGDTVDPKVAGQLLNDQRGATRTVTGAEDRISFEPKVPAAQPDLCESEGAP